MQQHTEWHGGQLTIVECEGGHVVHIETCQLNLVLLFFVSFWIWDLDLDLDLGKRRGIFRALVLLLLLFDATW